MGGALDATDPAARVMARMVGATGTSYDCPNVEAVDGYIRKDLARIAKIVADGNHAPLTVDQLRTEVDQLLERRLWLQECGPPEL